MHQPVRSRREPLRAGAAPPAPRRCTAGWRPAPVGAGPAGRRTRQRIGRDDARARVRAARAAPSSGSAPASTGSISTADHRVTGVEQAEGQRAEARGPISSTASPGVSSAVRDDAADGVRVVHEVLPERLGRADARAARPARGCRPGRAARRHRGKYPASVSGAGDQYQPWLCQSAQAWHGRAVPRRRCSPGPT